MRRLRAFAAFWYDFVVGDDWRVAVGLAVALGATALLAEQDVAAWWLMPLAVVAVLAESLRRATHGHSSAAGGSSGFRDRRSGRSYEVGRER